MRLPTIHKKGILTVGLIVLTESISFSNAVQFWSTYNSWSNQHGRGRANFQQNENEENSRANGFFFKSTNFAKRNAKAQECAAGSLDETCSRRSKASMNNVLHPRKLTRVATNAYYDCCKKNAPTCNALDVRGGHGLHNQPISAETAAAAAETVVSAVLPTPYNLHLNIWKVIFQIFLTAMNVACWLIPLRAKKITENKLAMSLANAFSGGVFLSLAFGHLIPECVHGFEGMNEALPYMIVLGGYLLIFFVEKVAFDAHGLMHDCGADHHTHGGDTKEVVELKNENGAGGQGRSAVILLGALAVHSILEMTALGLARSFGDSALLSLSIALHQVSSSTLSISCIFCTRSHIVDFVSLLSPLLY